MTGPRSGRHKGQSLMEANPGALASHERRPGAPGILFGGVEPLLELLARLGRRELALGDGDVELRPRRVDVAPGLLDEVARPALQRRRWIAHGIDGGRAQI